MRKILPRGHDAHGWEKGRLDSLAPLGGGPHDPPPASSPSPSLQHILQGAAQSHPEPHHEPVMLPPPPLPVLSVGTTPSGRWACTPLLCLGDPRPSFTKLSPGPLRVSAERPHRRHLL